MLGYRSPSLLAPWVLARSEIGSRVRERLEDDGRSGHSASRRASNDATIEDGALLSPGRVLYKGSPAPPGTVVVYVGPRPEGGAEGSTPSTVGGVQVPLGPFSTCRPRHDAHVALHAAFFWLQVPLITSTSRRFVHLVLASAGCGPTNALARTVIESDAAGPPRTICSRCSSHLLRAQRKRSGFLVATQ